MGAVPTIGITRYRSALVATTLGILATAACREGSDSGLPDTPELIHDALNPRVVVSAGSPMSHLLGRPYGMIVAGSSLWIADAAKDPFLFQFNVEPPILKRALGREGEGPGDFKSATDLSTRGSDSTGVWVFDVTTKRLTFVSNDPDASPTTIGPLPHDVIHATWLGEHRLVGITRSDTSRILMLDSTGNVVSRLPGPLLGPDSVPVTQRSRLSSGIKVYPHPMGTRFAVMYLAAGKIELFDSSGTHVVLAKVPFASDGEFEINDSTGNWTMRAPRNFYVACATDPDKLLCLFSGRRRGDFEGADASSGRFLHAFDWDGNLIGVYALDRDATSLAMFQGKKLVLTSLGSDSISTASLPSGT